MGWLMEPIYYSISWILIQWHALWDLLIPGAGLVVATTWPWILAIVFLVITVRIILFPVFVKQIRSQRAMQALQPKMKELQEKYKGDQQTLRQEMMKLYQTEKVNPLMGCLPMFLQIPVFLGLFHVLSYLNPLAGANSDPNRPRLYGWTNELFESASHAKLFGAPISMAFRSPTVDVLAVDGNPTAVKIVAATLVIIMMFTTFLTSRQMILKTGWQQDPQQRMIQKLMLYGIPISLLLSGWYFPVGVVIYWVTQNIFSLGQQYWVLHKYPPPVTSTAGKIGPDAMRSSAVARFFAGEPIKLPAAPARPGAPVSPVQPGSKWNPLKRRKAEATLPPAPEPKTLGPRPGAKPVPPKAVPPKAGKPAGGPPPGQSTNGATPATSAAGNGAEPDETVESPTPPAAKPGPQKAAGGGQRAAARKTGGGPRKTTPSRKGAGSRKGGPRR